MEAIRCDLNLWYIASRLDRLLLPDLQNWSHLFPILSINLLTIYCIVLLSRKIHLNAECANKKMIFCLTLYFFSLQMNDKFGFFRVRFAN